MCWDPCDRTRDLALTRRNIVCPIFAAAEGELPNGRSCDADTSSASRRSLVAELSFCAPSFACAIETLKAACSEKQKTTLGSSGSPLLLVCGFSRAREQLKNTCKHKQMWLVARHLPWNVPKLFKIQNTKIYSTVEEQITAQFVVSEKHIVMYYIVSNVLII